MNREALLVAGSWLGIAAGLLLYHRLVVEPALRVGIIDLAEVYRAQESAFSRQISLATSDTERERALEQVKEFAQRLTLALEVLPRECQCLVVIKGAGIPPPHRALELTEVLRRKVGQP